MSAVSSESANDLPASARSLIRRVRQRVRRDAVAGGLLLVVIAFITVFWGTSLIEAGWFRLQRLELPVGLRTIVLFLCGSAGCLLLIQRVAFPLFRSVTDSDIAVLLERQFPQFQDRLIASVESAAGRSDGAPLTRAMQARTVREAWGTQSK